MIKDRVNTCVGLALLRCKTTVMIVLLTDLIDLSRLCDWIMTFISSSYLPFFFFFFWVSLSNYGKCACLVALSVSELPNTPCDLHMNVWLVLYWRPGRAATPPWWKGSQSRLGWFNQGFVKENRASQTANHELLQSSCQRLVNMICMRRPSWYRGPLANEHRVLKCKYVLNVWNIE